MSIYTSLVRFQKKAHRCARDLSVVFREARNGCHKFIRKPVAPSLFTSERLTPAPLGNHTPVRQRGRSSRSLAAESVDSLFPTHPILAVVVVLAYSGTPLSAISPRHTDASDRARPSTSNTMNLLLFLLFSLVFLPYSAAFQCFDDSQKPYTCDDDVRFCVKDQQGVGQISRFCSGDGHTSCNKEGCSYIGDAAFCCCSSDLCNAAPATQMNAFLFTITALFAAITVLYARY
uniref:Uncharacterized protein n=1 Tax=Plectus sambesii TaxID=2011161 RepID=A0A914US37_9BILA